MPLTRDALEVLARLIADNARITAPEIAPPLPRFFTNEVAGHLLPFGAPTREEIPGVLFHATSHLPAIRQSGYLRAGAGAEHGGLGGMGPPAVSLTPQVDTMGAMLRALNRAGQVARGEKGPEGILEFARRDAARAGASARDYERIANEALDVYGLRDPDVLRQRVKDASLPRMTLEALRSYMRRRGDFLGGEYDPLIMGPRESFAPIRPGGLGAVVVEKGDIPEEARLSYGPDRQIGEVRVHSDIPLMQSRFLQWPRATFLSLLAALMAGKGMGQTQPTEQGQTDDRV